jgi:hypothetical protein
MMDYACPIWRCAARSYVKQLQVLQSKCLRIATGAPWYISSRQIHDDLRVPFFEEHTTALTESYDSKLAGGGNPLVRQLGRYLRWPRADASCRMRKLRDQLTSQGRIQNGGQVDIETCSLLTSWVHFGHPDWGFTVIFLSCKVNARVKWKKSGHGPRPPPPPRARRLPRSVHFEYITWFATLGSTTWHPSNQISPPPPQIGSLCAPRAVTFSVPCPGRESGL